MSNLSDFKNKSQEQMIEYAVRMRKERDEAQSDVERLENAIATHRAYIHNARARWPNAGDGDVQVTSGDISLWDEVGIEEPPRGLANGD